MARVELPQTSLLSSPGLSIWPESTPSNPFSCSKYNFQNLNSHIKIQTFEEFVQSLNLNFKFPHSQTLDAFLKENKYGLKFSTVYSYNKIFSDLKILTNELY